MRQFVTTLPASLLGKTQDFAQQSLPMPRLRSFR
jgi:hypothetical protein